MAIAKKPNSNRIATLPNREEKAAEAFISGAGVKPESEPSPAAGMKPTTMRFEPEFLKRIDKAAKRRGVNRTAWIRYVISEALEVGEG